MTYSKDDLTPEEAIAMLPEGETIHTFLGGGGMMLGCDCSREYVVTAIHNSPSRRRAGRIASDMGHRLAIMRNGTWLFVETAKELAP